MDKLHDILNEIDAILDESAGANGALDRYRRIASQGDILDDALADHYSTKKIAKSVNSFKKDYEKRLKGGIYGDLPSSKINRRFFKKHMDEKLKEARDNAQESKNFASGKIVGIKAPNDVYGREQTIDANIANPADIAKYDRQNRKVSEIHNKINKRAQNESTTDILNEIDSILDESAGNHGLVGRIALEKYKTEKKKNDERDMEVEKTRKQYIRAGYEDKAPANADRSLENSYKDTYDADKKFRNDRNLDWRYGYARKDPSNKSHTIGTRASKNISLEYDDRMKNNAKKVNNQLHDRINKRAQNESTTDILNDIDYLLNS